LALWPGSRILLLWIALVVIEGGLLLFNQVRGDHSPHTRLAIDSVRIGDVSAITSPDLDSVLSDTESVGSQGNGATVEPGGFQKVAEGFPRLLDSLFTPLLQPVSGPSLTHQFFLFLALLAAIYAPPLALAALTVMWLIARHRSGKRLPR
jgi:hypothetical protein